MAGRSPPCVFASCFEALFVNVHAASSSTAPTTRDSVTAVIRGFFTISRMRARSERLPDNIVVAQSVCCMTPLLPEIWSRSVRP